MGLILVIPIAGQIILLGWLLATLDNLRAGHHELPAAGFSYFGRGVRLFVVLLVYGLVPPVLFAGLLGLAIAIGIPQGGIFVLALGYAVLLVGELVLALLPPWLIVATERGGILGGLNLPAIVSRATGNGEQSVIIALFALVANVIGSLGAFVCLVGAYFSTPYGYAILAAVTLYYERSIAGARAPGVVT